MTKNRVLYNFCKNAPIYVFFFFLQNVCLNKDSITVTSAKMHRSECFFLQMFVTMRTQCILIWNVRHDIVWVSCKGFLVNSTKIFRIKNYLGTWSLCDTAELSGSEKRITYPTRSNFVSRNYNCINVSQFDC
jgi:hypothetical protein